MSKSRYIIVDVQSIYASIQEETDSVEEINNFAGDVYAAVATSMLHEGYSASVSWVSFQQHLMKRSLRDLVTMTKTSLQRVQSLKSMLMSR